MKDYPEETLHALFERQAIQTPEAVALIDAKGELSFRALDQQANALAHYLIARGVRPRTNVGICIERSRNVVVAALGVMKAGAAYVALDPESPAERLTFITKDTELRHVVTKSDLCEQLPEGIDAVSIDRVLIAEAGVTPSPPVVGVGPDDSCSIIYTSGSTGKPKGVASSHRASVVMFSWLWHAHPFGSGECFCHHTPLSFIVSAWEIFAPLLHGVPVALAPPEATRDPLALLDFIIRSSVTRVLLVPTLLRLLIEGMENHGFSLQNVRFWICVGELLPAQLARRLFALSPDAFLLNLYGCSETHSAACYTARGSAPALGCIPIGKPLSHRRLFLLDEQRRPVVLGTVGEIYIGGDGISRGYVGRPEMSRQRFVAIPELGEQHLYRTGDLARLLSDGSLELLGRSDRQVQIRGHRVELVEVETTLLDHPDISACFVRARDTKHALELTAYVVPKGDGFGNLSLRAYMKERLPEWMVPTTFIFLPELPTTPNGKLDPLALPDPDRTRTLETRCILPRTETEVALAEIWADVLALRPIGIRDNFFDLGGYSNKAVTTLLRVRNTLGVELSLKAFFELQTIEKIAEKIDGLRLVDDDRVGDQDDMVRGVIE